MKVIKVEMCMTEFYNTVCPYCQEYSTGFGCDHPEFEGLPAIEGIPDWCPLEDAKEA